MLNSSKTGSNKRNIVLLRPPSAAMEHSRHPRHIYPPLPLKYIQALLMKEGHHVRLIDGWTLPFSLEEINRMVVEGPADLLIVHINTFNAQESFDAARIAKENKGLFVIGTGQDVTARPDRYGVPGTPFDAILPGEPEQRIADIIEKWSAQGRPLTELLSESLKEDGGSSAMTEEGVNRLPMLHWEKEEFEMYRYIYTLRLNKKVVCGYVVSSRGCPRQCVFCSSAVRKSYGQRLVLRDPVHVVQEIEHLMGLGVNVVSFEDDDFTASRRHVLSICEEIQKRKLNIRWVCNARIDELDDDVLARMREAGCILLLLGVESASQRIINLLKKSAKPIDWKEKARETFRSARRAGIATCGLFIIGSPTETEDEVDETIRLAKELAPDLIKVHYFTPYPGSEAYRQFQSMIDPLKELKMYHYCEPEINVSGMDDKVLKKKQREFYKRVLLNPPFIFRHLRHYFFYYLHNRAVALELLWKLSRVIFGE